MPILRLAEMTWKQVKELDKARVVAFLPLGAIEAHGPHLPLATDGIIAQGMAEEAAGKMAARGFLPVMLPTLHVSAAPFARRFPGTLDARPQAVATLIVDMALSLARAGIRLLGIANAHLDPAHLGCVHEAVQALRDEGRIRVAFPDLTRRHWGSRLTEEFKSGACHAGRFEGSLVLALDPTLVREEVRQKLEANPRSLSQAIVEGRTSFDEAGGPDAYFGDPAKASAREGKQTIRVLAGILEEALLAEMDS